MTSPYVPTQFWPEQDLEAVRAKLKRKEDLAAWLAEPIEQPKPSKAGRPYRGPARLTTDPITSPAKIEKIKENLRASSARDYALFVFALNTAYRAGDILALNIGDVRYLKPGDMLKVKEQKTGKERSVTINEQVHQALQAYIATRKPPRWASEVKDTDPLFVNQKLHTRLTRQSYGRLVKDWCKDAGLKGEHYATHTLRKTFGYQMRTRNRVPLEILQQIYGHAHSSTTLTYIAIQPEEIEAVYMKGL